MFHHNLDDDTKPSARPVGRPRKVESPEKFDELVDSYFAMCRDAKEPILLTGMILALGFCSKDTFYEYEKFPEFTDSVKRARMLIEMEYEKRLNTFTSAAAPIFALKNFGWKDKQEVALTTTDNFQEYMLSRGQQETD